VGIKTTFKPSKKLEKQLSRYEEAANTALRKGGFEIYNVVQKKYLRVVDGVAVSRRAKTSRGRKRKGTRTNPTKRKRWPGLRRRTGNLARHVKVGLEISGVIKILNSQFSRTSIKRMADSVQVGIGNEVPYGVLHEREGRKQDGRVQGKRNFYPYLLPSLKDAWNDVKKRFNRELSKVERSKPL